MQLQTFLSMYLFLSNVLSVLKIRHHGIEELRFQLPTVASIIAKKKAGKSSLIEEVSEIKVPRNDGTGSLRDKPAGASILIEDPPARGRRAWVSDANAPS